MLTLSTAPTVIDGQLEARHIDLRPFVLCAGEEIYVLAGRPDARRPAAGFDDRQQLAGRRQQRHLGRGARRPRSQARSANGQPRGAGKEALSC